MRRISYILLLFIFFLPGTASSQLLINITDTLQINLLNEYKLSANNIVPFSEILQIGDSTLERNEYSIDYRTLGFKLSDSISYSIFDTIYISYETMFTPFEPEYKRRSLVVKYDEAASDSIKIIKTESTALTTESIFGTGMHQSGTIVRGFTVGTNKDFTVNSGLRLQLSGKLSDELEIVAALTDENTPIQPEGNTERLEELDKVFIEVKHANAVGTFGDYDFNERVGEFGRINRKLQGLKAQAIFENHNGTFAFASSRGKFTTNQFNGSDGNQGPYRLYGINNENAIIVIAGSERVYLDGEQLKRGENNDYIIEYANAELVFTPKRLITSASRITVDFEYTDRQFQRNFIGGKYSGSVFDDKLKISLSYAREADDENNPVDISISDNDIKILSAAGDDRSLAVTSGIVLVQPDSTGKTMGTYTKIDTVISGSEFSYFVYAPGESTSLYNVSFSFVGSGNGDYNKESTGKFKFVGIGSGSYAPIRYLPLAQSRQFGNLVLESEPVKNLLLSLELAGSIWDKNNFSGLDDADNTGYARNIIIQFKKSDVAIGGINLGKIGFSLRDRFVQDRFTTLDRFNSIEFNREYNVTSQTADDEILREAGLEFQPFEQLNILSSYGMLKKGDDFKSNRYLFDSRLNNFHDINASYKIDYVESGNNLLKSSWNRQNVDANITLWKFQPGFEFLFEEKKDNYSKMDSLLEGSLRYVEAAPKLNLIDISGFTITSKYSIRNEYFSTAGKLVKQSKSILNSYSLIYKGIKEFNTDLSVTVRDKKFTDEFKQLGYLDNETILLRSQSRINLFQRAVDGDLYYEASTQKSAKLERIFVRVEKGLGNYIYLGDTNNNGVADEDEFAPTVYDGDYILTTLPTDELFPVIDLKLNTRWRIEFEKIFSKATWIERLIQPISTETSFRIAENSKEPDTKKIYLLNFSHFLNDSTTIRGSQIFQQDVHLFKNDNNFSVRLRYIQRDNVNQYSGGIEKGFFIERGVRLKLKLVEDIHNITEYINEIDNVNSTVNINRSRLVNGEEISTDFSYRPVQNIELGFKFSVGRTEDKFPDSPTIIDVNSQLVRFTYSLEGKGRLRIEGERNELVSNTSFNVIPFEVTDGKSIGKNYFWRLNFDYRIAANLQTTLSYDGRKQGKSDVIHTMRAEARAYF